MTLSDNSQNLVPLPCILKRLSITLAALVALFPPLGYWALSYQHTSDQLNQTAELISHAVSKSAHLHPSEWDLQLHQLDYLVNEFRPRNSNISISIRDNEGRFLIEENPKHRLISISRHADILNGEGKVGRVALEQNLTPTIYTGLAIGLVCLLIASALLAAIHTHSIRNIRNAATQTKQAQENLVQQQTYLDGILHSSENVGIIATDRDWVIQYCNRAAAHLFGRSRQHALGLRLCDLHEQLKQTIGDSQRSCAARQQVDETIFLISDQLDNQPRHIEARLASILDARHQPSGYTLICTDVTESRKASELIEHQALHDNLTDLPNRRQFKDQLNKALAQAKRHAHIGAVLFLDLDDFKHINDSLGHSQGDILLQMAAKRLQSCVREEDIVARLGGDEFVILLCELADAPHLAINNAQVLAEKIRLVLSIPYDIAPHTLHITPSIGISMFPNGDDQPDDIMRQADTAMYRAKETGRNTVKFFLPSMQQAAEDRLRTLGDLRQGINRAEFQVFFQLQFDSNRQPMGAEALVRWQHPDQGLLLPKAFIKLAEESGLIIELGEVILTSALTTLRTWLAEKQVSPGFRLSVNISPQQFKQADFVHTIERIIAHTDVTPDNVTLEITEGMLLEKLDLATEKILALKKIGVRFSVDDFGTGYSSLAYLKHLPVDEIKIDRTFVRDILEDESDAALVEAIVNISNHLGLYTVAEGVETQAQFEHLRALGCDAYQGHLFAKPAPKELLDAFLQSEQPMAS